MGNTIQDHQSAAGEREILMLRLSVEERKILLLVLDQDVEQKLGQQGRQSLAVVGDKGGRNSTTGMHGLGLGFDIELKILPQVENGLDDHK